MVNEMLTGRADILAACMRDRDMRVSPSQFPTRISLSLIRSTACHRPASDATASISISIFGSGSACTTQVVRAG